MSLTHTSVGIEFDPHQSISGNIETDEEVVVTGTKYRMLIPAKAPFYTNSVVVKCKNVELKLGTDYIFTHQYVTGVLRTGRVTHGMLWLLNPAYTDGFTVTYHSLGIGHATAQQIAAERETNKNVYPYKCQWEQVIGDVYFPPVDIRFDRANWRGELELMKAVVSVVDKPDAFLGNDTYWKGPLWPYTEESSKNYAHISENVYGPKTSGPWGLFRPFWRCLPSTRLAYTVKGFKGYNTTLPYIQVRSYTREDNYGSPTAADQVSLSFQISCGPASAPNYTAVVSAVNEQSNVVYSESFTLPAIRENDSIAALVQVDNGYIFFIITINDEESHTAIINPTTDNSAAFRSWFTKITNPAYRLVGLAGDFNQVDNLELITVPNQRADLGDVYEVIKHWKQTVVDLFDDSPAKAHVANKQNPHSATYGPSRAIERNGIATDSVNAYGGNESQLANYINARHPTQADLLLKILRAGSVARQMTGKLVTYPGVTSFGTSPDSVSLNKYLSGDTWANNLRTKKIISNGDGSYTAKTGAGVGFSLKNVPVAEYVCDLLVSGHYIRNNNSAVVSHYATWKLTPESTIAVRLGVVLWGGTLTFNVSIGGTSGGTVPEARFLEKDISSAFTENANFVINLNVTRVGNVFTINLNANRSNFPFVLDLDNPPASLVALQSFKAVEALKQPMVYDYQCTTQAINNTLVVNSVPGMPASSHHTGSQFQLDPKLIRFLGMRNTRIGATGNTSRLKAGANVLQLTKEGVLTWNGKPLLDPTTVGPHLPGSTGDAGDGIFYGTNSSTVTVTGNGIKNVPFICTFAPKQNVDLFTPAPRMVTSDYGNSSELAATPALITKLDAEFSGKLELAKAWINNLPLTGSVTIDKYTFGLTEVQNVPDLQLPISTLQKKMFDGYSHIGHKHDASVFGIGAATVMSLGVVKYGDLIDDNTLALDGSNVVKQADKLTVLDKDLTGLDTNVVIDIIRYGKSGTGSAGTGSMVAFMATIAKSTYFVRKEYPVPAKSFNLLELYPTTHLNAEFDVFVDLVGETAEYSVAPAHTVSESATRTKIGLIATDATAITAVNVFNTTRLGDIVELTSHEADVSAHFSKSPTMKEFGVNYPTRPLLWTSGASGLQRGLADWRAMGPSDWADMSSIQLKSDGEILLHGVGINFTGNEWRSFVSMKPSAKPPQTTVRWGVGGNDSANTMLETIICGYRGKDDVYNRISVIISRRKVMVDSNGNFCYAALGVNVGRNNYVLIGIPTTIMPDPSGGWDTLQPTVKFSSYYNPSELGEKRSFEAAILITLNGVNHTVILQLTATSKKIINTDGNTHLEIDITDRFPAGFIDLSELTDGSAPMYTYGVGGVFDQYATASLSFVDGTSETADVMDTTIDYFNNLSVMNRFVVEKDATNLGAVVTVDQMRNLFMSRSFALRTLSPDSIPQARTRADLMVSRDVATNYCYHFKF